LFGNCHLLASRSFAEVMRTWLNQAGDADPSKSQIFPWLYYQRLPRPALALMFGEHNLRFRKECLSLFANEKEL
jgi:hypothetical protein